jgi:phosphoribosylformylglycinamidine synthase
MEMHFSRAGAEPRILVINDTSQTAFAKSVERFIEELAQAHILVFPGGFSFADEPDGSGKFIAAFLKQKPVAEAVQHFIDSDHLVLGICNGFQGLIKSGLLPYGSITERKAGSPTLCSNDSYHHVATLVRTAIRSTRSPWLQELDPKLTYTLPVSHAEGKFIATEEQLAYLVEHDLIATTYIDNPNGSVMHIEGIVSENGNILGKMAHNERISDQLFINVEGTRGQDIFTSGVKYFQLGGNNS